MGRDLTILHGLVDLSRDTPSSLHSSNSLALCDTLVLVCHRVTHSRCRVEISRRGQRFLGRGSEA
eukprot:COSAG01_NODE_1932_length_8871_cov_9.527984_6_plen_65_part_00